MRALSALNISSHWKLNLHAILLRLINLLLLVSRMFHFTPSRSSAVALRVCSRGRLACHSCAESLIFHEEDMMKADEPTKSSLTFHPKLSAHVDRFVLDVWWKTPKHFGIFQFLETLIFCILQSMKSYLHILNASLTREWKNAILLIWEHMQIILSQLHLITTNDSLF